MEHSQSSTHWTRPPASSIHSVHEPDALATRHFKSSMPKPKQNKANETYKNKIKWFPLLVYKFDSSPLPHLHNNTKLMKKTWDLDTIRHLCLCAGCAQCPHFPFWTWVQNQILEFTCTNFQTSLLGKPFLTPGAAIVGMSPLCVHSKLHLQYQLTSMNRFSDSEWKMVTHVLFY